MFFHQFLDDRQAKTRAFGLGRNIGIEYLAHRSRLESRAIVFNLDLYDIDVVDFTER